MFVVYLCTSDIGGRPVPVSDITGYQCLSYICVQISLDVQCLSLISLDITVFLMRQRDLEPEVFALETFRDFRNNQNLLCFLIS